MGTRDYFLIGAAASLLGWTLPPTVQAQAWLSDRDGAGGSGIRVGNLELHPGIGLEGGYDSNVFLADDVNFRLGDPAQLVINEAPDASFTTRVSPHLYVSTLGRDRLTDADDNYVPPTLAFRGGLLGSLYWLPNVEAGSNARYDGRVDLEETIFPERVFSVALTQEGQVRRLPIQSNPGYQWHAGAGARASLGTDGGLLKGALRYKFGIDRFTVGGQDVSLGGFEVSDNDSHAHEVGQSLNWRFLPQTSLFQDASISFLNYVSEGDDSPQSDRYDSANVSLRVGANGALTKELSATLGVGYGAVFFADSSRDQDGLLAQARLEWRPTARVSTKLGYARSVAAALVGNTRVENRFTLGANATIGDVLLGANAGVRLVDFGADVQQQAVIQRNSSQSAVIEREVGQGALGNRSDVVLDIDVNGEVRLAEWLALTAQLGYLANFTDYAFLLEVAGDGSVGSTDQLFVSPAAYQTFTAMLGLRAFL